MNQLEQPTQTDAVPSGTVSAPGRKSSSEEVIDLETTRGVPWKQLEYHQDERGQNGQMEKAMIHSDLKLIDSDE